MQLIMQAVRVLQLIGQDNMMWETEKDCQHLSSFHIQKLLGQTKVSGMDKQQRDDTNKEQTAADIKDEDEGAIEYC
jgi:hypothetical protein